MTVNEHTTKDVQGQGLSNINLVFFFDVYQPSHGNVVFFYYISLVHNLFFRFFFNVKTERRKGIVRKKKKIYLKACTKSLLKDAKMRP